MIVVCCLMSGCASGPAPREADPSSAIILAGGIGPVSVRGDRVVMQSTTEKPHECVHLCKTQAFIRRHRYAIGAALAVGAISAITSAVRHSGPSCQHSIVVTHDDPGNSLNPTSKSVECQN